MKQLLYTTHRIVIAVLLLLLLAMAPAMAQMVVFQGDTTELAVVQMPGDNYEWEIYTDGTVDFATVPGNCPPAYILFVGGNTGASVNVKWLEPGIYFYKVTASDAAACTKNFKIGILEVKQSLPVATITDPDPAGICAGEPVKLEVSFTGTGPWNFKYTDGTTIWQVSNVPGSPYLLIIDPGPTTTTDYHITEVVDQKGTNTAVSNTVTQKVNPLPLPSTIYHR